MSLINDALKQANKAHQSQPREASTDASMEPVQAAPQSNSRIAAILAVLLLLVLAGAGWFLGQWWQYQSNASAPVTGVPLHASNHRTPPVETPSTDSVQPPPIEPLAPPPPIETVVEPPAPTPPPTEIVQATVKKAGKSNKQPIKQPDPVPPLVPVVTTPPPNPPLQPLSLNTNMVKPEPFPPLKVTFVFPSKFNPSANINGHIGVRLNEDVDGVKVIKIQGTKVTVEWKGRTKVISTDD